MFNSELKRAAIKRLKSACNRHEKKLSDTAQRASSLHELRTQSAMELIRDSEQYFSQLAGAPKEFQKCVEEYRIAYSEFRAVVENFREEANRVASASGSTAGAGVMAGVGVAALGPSAMMAFATTFGVASTGTAIGSLSGAAATSAAAAWLGGGAVAAGGGGVVAGEALLAFAGPVGWAIGGLALGGAAVYASSKNRKLSDDADRQTSQVEAECRALDAACVEIDGLYGLTSKHARETKKVLERLRSESPTDYQVFSTEQKQELGALKNHIETLCGLMRSKVTS